MKERNGMLRILERLKLSKVENFVWRVFRIGAGMTIVGLFGAYWLPPGGKSGPWVWALLIGGSGLIVLGFSLFLGMMLLIFKWYLLHRRSAEEKSYETHETE